MKFKEALERIEGLRFVAEKIDICSAIGRRRLYDSDFISGREALEREFGWHDLAVAAVSDSSEADRISAVMRLLMQARDIRESIRRLQGGAVPDDVELFEFKGLAFLAGELRELLKGSPLSEAPAAAVPDLAEAAAILDPEHTGNAHFHIYDAYSASLASKRAELRKVQALAGVSSAEAEALMAECMMLEDEIRTELGGRLRPFAPVLAEALEALGCLDVLLAKGRLAKDLGLCRPRFSDGGSSFRGLRYLPVEDALAQKGKEFQPVDVALPLGVTLVTGANMGGKTVTLKSVALAQAMAQFAFYVGAAEADIMPVEDIALSLGDHQSVADGLSSFGAEILKIDGILREVASGKVLLVEIDEPARTTNPDEGKAIVAALLQLLAQGRSMALVTTHYGNVAAAARRLRVRGLRESIPEGEALGADSLRKYMDYSLLEVGEGEVPREALRIGRLLGIDSAFAESIEKNLTN